MSIQQAYDAWSQTYDTDRNLTRDLDGQVMRSTLEGRHFESILELGCGTGKNTSLLAGAGRRVQALDFSREMLARARQKERAGNVLFCAADLTQPWPCAGRGYDLIVCNLVLEHIEDLKFIFFEVARALQPGGEFLIHELHPFRQYEGKAARFDQGTGVTRISAHVHHVSEFLDGAAASGLALEALREWWHIEDRDEPPRIISFLFRKP